MEKFWAMFRLRENASLNRYLEFATTVDLRITPFEPGCIKFDIWTVRDGPGEARFQFVEEFEVDSLDEWRRGLTTNPRLISVVEAGNEFWDKSSVLTLYGRRLD